MNSRRLMVGAFTALSFIAAHSQISTSSASVLSSEIGSEQTELFKHLDLSISAGSSGLGIDLSTHFNQNVGVRAGFSFMPHLVFHNDYQIQGLYKSGEQWSSSSFANMSALLEQFTGYNTGEYVRMDIKPTYYNFKLLFDFSPLKDKRWHVTAGFYLGSGKLGEMYNNTEAMPALFSVMMYNNMYEKVVQTEYFYDNPIYNNTLYLSPDIIDKLREKMSTMGRFGLHIGNFKHDIYYQDDVLGEDGEVLQKKGEVRYSKGEPYLLEPDDKSMVRVNVKSHRFKPYLGFGYGTDMSKSKSGWGISFDAGLLFWGGAPSSIDHNGINFTTDLDNVPGKAGNDLSTLRGLKVFPVLDVHLTKRLF